MNKIYKDKAFTLIELLVVIAIIGVLASVALSSLNSARVKARDAFVKSTLASMHADAQLEFENNNGVYSTAGFGFSDCQSPPGLFGSSISNKMVSLAEKGITAGCSVKADGQKFAIFSGSPAHQYQWYYCIDYRGSSIKEQIPFGVTNDYDCDSNNIEE